MTVVASRSAPAATSTSVLPICWAFTKNLRLLFPQNRDLAYRWMTTRNKAFENLTPVEVIRQWGFAGLLMVRAYLDRARGV
jgi:hypothetical protein